MSNIEALKEQARQHEQKEEWQKACDHYMRAIEKLDDEEQPDIGLYNRVGDLLIRIGNYEQALEHFDRAADLYVEADLPNNAIAICKKVIRHLPNRTQTYLRMGKIRAEQGFLVDARESYLTYVEKVQAAGDMEEALRALGEFAELAPEDPEIRLAVAEQLIQHEREEEALEQLAAGYAVLKQRDEDEAASSFEEKILELDPDADLDALAEASPVAEEAFEKDFGFETTALDDAFEDEVAADFGEIVLGGEEDGGSQEAGGSEEAAGSEEPAGSEAAGDGVEARVPAMDDVAPAEPDGDGAEPEAGVASGEEETDDLAVGDFQEIALDDEGEDLPLLSDFVEEALADEDEEEEEAPEPLPLLTDEDETPGSNGGEVVVGFDLDTASVTVDEVDEDDIADVLAEAMQEASAEEPAPEEEPAAWEGDAGPEESEGSVPADAFLDLGAVEEPEGLDGLAGAEDVRADGEMPAGEVGAAVDGEEAPREAWESLYARLREGEPEAGPAQELVELAFKLDDQDALVRSYLHLAEALEAGGDEARARGVYEQVLSLDPDNRRARGALEEDAGEAGPSEEEAGQADEYVDLGSLIFDEEEEKTTRFRVAYEEPSGDEEADFARMLSQFKAKVAENFDVSDVKAHHDLGTAYKEMGLLDEAVEKFQEALRASPGHLPSYELLGQTFMDKGQPVAAVRVLERALRVPHQVEDELIGIYYFLARAQEEVGNTEAAIEFYDRVFALDINFGDVTERLRKLR